MTNTQTQNLQTAVHALLQEWVDNYNDQPSYLADESVRFEDGDAFVDWNLEVEVECLRELAESFGTDETVVEVALRSEALDLDDDDLNGRYASYWIRTHQYRSPDAPTVAEMVEECGVSRSLAEELLEGEGEIAEAA